MLKLIWAELGRRRGRAAALVAGVALATAAFTVLTGASRTARLEARGEVSRQFRTAYDVLVRPQGAQQPLERREGLLQPSAVSSAHGGITMEQLRKVRGVPGVEVAAPLADFGEMAESIAVKVPLVRPAQRRSVFRSQVQWSAEGGLTRIGDPASYVYVTPHTLVLGAPTLPDPSQDALAAEKLANGNAPSVCPFVRTPDDALSAFSPVVRSKVDCWSTRTGLGGYAPAYAPYGVAQLGARATFAFVLPLVGIDPVAEDQLSGIRRARTSGRFLTARDRPELRHIGIGRLRVPVVVSDALPSSLSAQVKLTRLPDTLASRIPSIDDAGRLRRELAAAPGTEPHRTTVDARAAYAQYVDGLRARPENAEPDALFRTGAVRYRRLGARHLQALPRARQDEAWVATFTALQSGGFFNAPVTGDDVAYRALTQRPVDLGEHPQLRFRAVGTYRARPAAGSREVLDPFTVPAVRGADARSRALLHDRPLEPDGNPAGLVGLPPMMLTTLAARSALFNDTYVSGGAADRAAPLASIRVRVAGVGGADATSRERIRLVADRIRQRTGLAVDITAGASATSVQVDAPAGRFGRPALSLSEPWVRKGVAVAVLSAVDRKSVLLFCLVAVVCVLFCLSAMAAAVRQRTADLAVLACVGWTRGALSRLLLGEVVVLGTAAGVIGLMVAVPAGAIFDLSITLRRAALAVPAAALLSVLSALGPVLRATRADPLGAVRPPARAPRRRRGGAVSVRRMAVANTLAVPGRALLGALGLAVGILALTMLLAITLAFRGAVVGTVLGDAVTVQVRGVDYVSVAVTLALGIFGLADVLYLNVRDRAAELASLRATGWPESALNRMIAYEGLLIGTVGGLVGAGLGLLAAHLFTDRGVATLLAPTALGVAVGAACAALAALAPVLSLRRLPTAQLLAEE